MRLDNRSYWDALAPDYDSIYSTPWCNWEDDRIGGWLHRLHLPEAPVVLDIGCGTGGFLRQLAAADIKSRYFGVDISRKMIDRFHADEGAALSVTVTARDVADYQWPLESPPDLVASIYSPLSFSEERWTIIGKLAAQQRSGDKLLITLLNRYSLRRMLRGQLSGAGDFRSRGAPRRSTVEVFFERAGHIRSSLADVGYRIIYLGGDGPLSGVLEVRPLWRANAWLGRSGTALSHTLIVVAEKILSLSRAKLRTSAASRHQGLFRWQLFAGHAQTTSVRTQHLPHPANTARYLDFPG